MLIFLLPWVQQVFGHLHGLGRCWLVGSRLSCWNSDTNLSCCWLPTLSPKPPKLQDLPGNNPAVTDHYTTAPLSLIRTLNNPISSEDQVISQCPKQCDPSMLLGQHWVTAVFHCHPRLFSRSWSPSIQNFWRQRDFVKESLRSWFWWKSTPNLRCSLFSRIAHRYHNASLSLARMGSNSFPTIKCPQGFSWSKIMSLLSHHPVFALPFDSALLEYATGKYCK